MAMAKPPTLELVRIELEKVKAALEETREPFRELKRRVSEAHAAKDKDLKAELVSELNKIEARRLELKNDQYFLWSVEKELLAGQTPETA